MLLRWLDRTTLPVEADGLTPTALAGLSPADAQRRPIRVGNQRAELGDLFAVDPAESGGDSLTIEGDMRNVSGIGRGMDGGTLTVRGVAGPHAGAGMSGGVLEIDGDAGDWAGAAMRGGLLKIGGNAGRCLGGAYPGERLGMRDGVILVRGSVGDDAGRRMRRGLIAVRGAAGDGFGSNLVAGSLFAFGPIGRYAGLGMKRGTLVALGPAGVEVAPSFASSGRYRFPFLTIYLRRLSAWGFGVPEEVLTAEMERYNGDLAEGGRGEILVLRPLDRG
jgi:formylmethanofuran dehydrogenase subunit C